MYMTLMLVINNVSNRVIGIISLERLFSKFYRRHHKLVSKFSVGLKSLLHQGLSELEFYDDSLQIQKIMGRTDFSYRFRKVIIRYKRIVYRYNRMGYNSNVMRKSAYLVINPITADNFAARFNCTPVDRATDSMMALT